MLRVFTYAAVVSIPLLIECPVLAFAQEPSAIKTIEPGLKTCEYSSTLMQKGPDAMLARGFNLPNWDPDYKGFKPDDGLLKVLRQLGFTHIRLPVRAEHFMARFSSSQQISSYLEALGKTVHRLEGLGYVISIDMHPSRPFQSLHKDIPDEGYNSLEEAWDRIAQKAKGWSRKSVYFELLNEPVPPQSVWWAQAQKLATHLNKTDPGRRLIVGPAVFQRVEALANAEPLKGEGLVYAIHYYDPMAFTHQGMSWMPGSSLAIIGHMPFPGDATSEALLKQVAKLKSLGKDEAAKGILESYRQGWNAERIATALGAVGAWSQRNKAPVIVNEFGALTFDVDPHDRVNWLRAVRQGAESNCLGWTHWDFSDGFKMVDPRTTLPDPLVLDALLPEQ
nr:cellulase family glycosylhydrolase [uncultured Cohaesibacter sp.]